LSGNQLSVEDLNARRRQAVQLRLQGQTLDAVVRATGLSAPTIIGSVKAFKSGGWAAVVVQPRRGRPPRQLAVFSPQLESSLLQTMLASPPDVLWSVKAVAGWLKAHGAVVGRTGIHQWCRRVGLYDPEHVCPEGGTAGVHCWRIYTHRPPPLAATRAGLVATVRSRVAVDPRGAVRWRLLKHPELTAAEHLAWLQSLVAEHGGRTVLELAEADHLRHDQQVQAWLAEQATGVELRTLSPGPRARTDHWHPPQPGRSPYPHSPASESTTMTLTHLQRLEAESIHIMREVVAEAENPVMLYSIGKDSAVMLHLAMKAFYPSKPPFPLLHVDTRWKFKEMYGFRDRMVKELGLNLLVHINPDGIAKDINPFTHGSAIHTDIMKTEGLKQALDQYGFDAAFGGARRDEEKSRAKERIFSFRTEQHRWDPKNQRPELWKLYNARKHKGESMRVFPLSNWTELDIWQYIYLQNIPIVPLYYSAVRPVVHRDGTLIMVDDERMPLRPGEVPMMKKVRFRTLGCYPLTGAVESEAATLPEIIQEMLLTTTSERQGRMIDHDSAASMEKKKQEGYF
jgi:sulfate adenylyltransferase subunit 2